MLQLGAFLQYKNRELIRLTGARQGLALPHGMAQTGPGELRIRRIRIRITAALMPVDARITSWGIMAQAALA